MTATVLSGKEIAQQIRAGAAAKAEELVASGVTPRLSVVVATDDGGSAWYVSSIAKAAAKAGIACDVIDLGVDATPALIGETLTKLSADDAVHGIILQTPLPPGVTLQDMAEAINPAKDVDGANPLSLGRLAAGMPAFAPATAEAVVVLLDHHGVPLEGRSAVVVGRSTVVGKPLAHLLLSRNATVTVCHSRTTDLAAVTSRAEILVAAVGQAQMLGPDHVAPGAVVVDVGTNPTDDGGLVGDVDTDAVVDVAGSVTPVPGGVGPVTTALLLRHTVEAASR